MYWFNQDELAYYHPNTDGYCYCELLLSPQDLILQARIPKIDIDTMILRLRVYTSDGVTVIAGGSVIEDYTKFIVAVDTNGDYYITFQLQSFPLALCDYASCFILRFEVFANIGGVSTPVFDKFTQAYCVADCCTYTGEIEAGEGDKKQTFTASVGEAELINACGKPVARIISKYPCIDNYSGDYYGAPTIKLAGKNNPDLDDIPFYKVSNIDALLRRLPRNLKITIAQNCKVQKSESARQWSLQGSIPIPQWKSDELESMFMANSITVNTREYNFAGDAPFQKIMMPQIDNAAQFYRLDTIVEECRLWQVFGCGANCITKNTTKFIPFPEQPGAGFKVISQDGYAIANSTDDFAVYLQSLPGMVSVTDVSYAYMAYGYGFVFQVNSDGYIPSYFYDTQIGELNKIFTVDEVPDLMQGCQPITLGTITDSSANCVPATIGTITDTTQGQATGVVYSQGDWAVQSGSSAASSGNTIVVNFVSRNTAYGGGQGGAFELNGDVIGVLIDPFIPSQQRTVIDNSTVPGSTIIITTAGEIKWYGPVQIYPSYGEVVVINLIFNT